MKRKELGISWENYSNKKWNFSLERLGNASLSPRMIHI